MLKRSPTHHIPVIALALSALVQLPGAAGAEEVRVLTDRTASHLDRLFKAFSKHSGVKVKTNYVGDGLLARLTSRPREADLVYTKNAYLLELAKGRRLLSPFRSGAIIKHVPAVFRDPDRQYAVLSYRARVIFHARGRVKPATLSSYFELADPRWRGKICMRSGLHEYNLSLFSQLAVVHGLAATGKFLRGLRKNLARSPRGNDRAQVRAVYESKCDLALANSYYQGIMLARPEQRPWAEASRVFFPDQKGRGALVIRSGAALTRARHNVRAATRLLEFLTDDYAQTFFAQALFAYPVKAGVPLAAVNRALGREQGIKGGDFKRHVVDLAAAAKLRRKIVEELTRLAFDKAR